MAKDTGKWIVGILAVGFLALIFLGGNQGTQQPSSVGGGVQAGNVVVNAFQPTLTYSVTAFYIPGTALSGNTALVTLAGNLSTLAQGTAKNANNADPFSIQILGTSTYYAPAPDTGTVQGTTNREIKMRLIGTSLSGWANNDPSNGTARNSTSAPDAVGSGGSVSPEICLKNSTQYSTFGNGKYGVIIDYNGLTWNTPTISGATVDGSVVNSAHARATGTTASLGIKFDSYLEENATKCFTMNLQAKSGVNPGTYVADGNVTSTWIDYFTYVNSTTGAVESGYENNAGGDTNSATNTAVTYYVS
jgi:hypothetical protein